MLIAEVSCRQKKMEKNHKNGWYFVKIKVNNRVVKHKEMVVSEEVEKLQFLRNMFEKFGKRGELRGEARDARRDARTESECLRVSHPHALSLFVSLSSCTVCHKHSHRQARKREKNVFDFYWISISFSNHLQ